MIKVISIIGCIFVLCIELTIMKQGELLQTLEPDCRKPVPLFPGQSCYPLSDHHLLVNRERFETEYSENSHQLKKIFEIIGTPTK